MKKCYIIILFFLVLAFCRTYGQTNKYEYGIEGGPSLISLHGNQVISEFHNSTIGFTSGLFFQYNFKKIISLRTNLAYERKGSTIKGKVLDEIGNSIGNVRSNLNFDYLTIPILVRATFGNKYLFFVNTGPYLGYLLKQTIVSRGEKIPTTTKNEASLYKKIDLGISAGLGLLIPYKQHFAFSLEVRNNLGLYNVSAEPIMNGGSIKTNSTNLLFGLVYKFGERSTNE